MKRFTKHSNILKGAMLGLIIIATITSPFSVSFSGDELVAVNVANAETTGSCPPGQTYQLLSNGTDQLSGSCTNTATGQVTLTNVALNNQPHPTQCTVSVTSWSAIFNPICWGRVVGSLIGGLLVYIASWFLTIAGMLFNWVLNITVVQFGQFMKDSVIQAITSAWTAFRDISNIVIIGMFTFIAISIILGLKEFGQKKLIAHVLIIAVLINFSLLFSKMVIDASNFVATQFYNAGLSQSAAGGGTSTTQLGVGNCPDGAAQAGTASQCYGIAGAFMDYAGVASLLDTRKATADLADSLDNGWLAFLHAVFVAILFTAAALVLFYGSYLLVARAVLFIFLMGVSALAFASYLVPVWDKSNYGFGAWKDALLKNALLAPLMIMFLWMTLNVANAMKAAPGGGTLGDLITHPTKSLDINALFAYVVILGMLFMSFKLSSHLAGKIAGFGLFKDVLLAAASIPVAGIAAYAAPWAYRRFVGHPAVDAANKLEGDIKKKSQFIAANKHILGADGIKPHQRELFDMMERKRSLEETAKRTGDFRNTALRGVASALGVPGFMLKGTKTNAADTVKTRSEDVSKGTAGLAVGAEDAKKLFQEQRVQQRRELREKQQDRQKTLAVAEREVEDRKRSEGLTNVRATAEKEMQEAAAQKETLSLQPKTADRQRQLDEQEERINKAREDLTHIDKVEEPVRAAAQALEEVTATLEKVESETEKEGAERITQHSKETAQEAAEHHAHRYSKMQRFSHAFRKVLPASIREMPPRSSSGEAVAHKARKRVEERVKFKPFIDREKAIQEALGTEGEASKSAPPAEPEKH